APAAHTPPPDSAADHRTDDGTDHSAPDDRGTPAHDLGPGHTPADDGGPAPVVVDEGDGSWPTSNGTNGTGP
ncbi:hypothetical protein ACFU8I_28305, partial [Streptomyces sp. NPDC057540]|uniref:hypothetical protein n=1 Tax=Streptomyces sp. NPDC057540 TaxID=3346160 RepID=UPI0036926BAE